MRKLKSFVVWIFPDADDLDTENGENTMKCADNPDETASFDSPEEAQVEMRERCVDYGALTQIYNLDTRVVTHETTDEGCTWHEPAHVRKSAEPIPA